MPTCRAACTKVVFHEKKMIVIGGVDENQVPIAAVDCFDIERETWEQLPPLPKGVVGPFVTKINEKIYCIAGSDKKDANQCVVFDLDRNEWQNLPEMPTRRYACGGYVYKNKIYITGGRDVKDPVKNIEAFDLETKQWEQLGSMNSVRVFYNIVAHKGCIYVVGGFVPMVGLSKIVEKYDIEKNEWTRIKDLNIVRSDGAVGVVGARVIIAAGVGGSKVEAPGCLNSAVTMNATGDGWERLPNMKTSRASTSYLEFDGKLAVIGGAGDGGPQAVVEILSVTDSKK